MTSLAINRIYEEGGEMRERIVRNVKFLDRRKMLKKFREWNVSK